MPNFTGFQQAKSRMSSEHLFFNKKPIVICNLKWFIDTGLSYLYLEKYKVIKSTYSTKITDEFTDKFNSRNTKKSIKSVVYWGMLCEKLCHGGVISKQNPHTETLQKPNSNFTSNTHPFRLKITSKTYFNYFLYSEYQLNLVNLIKSYLKIDLSYREISILLNDKGYRSDNGTLWNRITVKPFANVTHLFLTIKP